MGPPFLRRVTAERPQPRSSSPSRGVNEQAAATPIAGLTVDDFPAWYHDNLTDTDTDTDTDTNVDTDTDSDAETGDERVARPEDRPSWPKGADSARHADDGSDRDREDEGADTIHVARAGSSDDPAASYVWDLAAVRTIGSIDFDAITVIVGDNGAGKSTVVEGIAVAAGFNPEGGSRNLQFSSFDTHSPLWEHLTLEWVRRPRWGWFARSETFYEMASAIERDPYLVDTFPRFHRRSHGEAALDLAEARFTGAGLYLLDEPESGLSIASQRRLVQLIQTSVGRGSQFVIATHSPVLATIPGAAVSEIDRHLGARRIQHALSAECMSDWLKLLSEPHDFHESPSNGQSGEGA